MGYYLSRADRKILELFIPRLKEATTDFYVKLNKPEILIRILRSAKTQDDLKWISDKYKYYIKDGKLHFDINQLVIEEFQISVMETVDERELDFFGLANVILLERPLSLVFTNISSLTPEEHEKIEILAEANDYSLRWIQHTIKIEKKL